MHSQLNIFVQHSVSYQSWIGLSHNHACLRRGFVLEGHKTNHTLLELQGTSFTFIFTDEAMSTSVHPGSNHSSTVALATNTSPSSAQLPSNAPAPLAIAPDILSALGALASAAVATSSSASAGNNVPLGPSALEVQLQDLIQQLPPAHVYNLLLAAHAAADLQKFIQTMGPQFPAAAQANSNPSAQSSAQNSTPPVSPAGPVCIYTFWDGYQNAL